jgi:membrane associated rhomboid family serine protease
MSFIILSSCLYYFYKEIASKVLILCYLMSGILLWIIGRDSCHIGASGWIYALAFFMFLSGLIRGYVPLIAISLIITFLYGSMVWHVFPWKVNDPISWEGHLSGFISGLILSVIYRNQGPQKPVKIWEEDDTDDTDDYESELNNVDEDENAQEEPILLKP